MARLGGVLDQPINSAGGKGLPYAGFLMPAVIVYRHVGILASDNSFGNNHKSCAPVLLGTSLSFTLSRGSILGGAPGGLDPQIESFFN